MRPFYVQEQSHAEPAQERKKPMVTGKALNGKPNVENPRMRFDDVEVASAATPRRGSLLYKKIILTILSAATLAVLNCFAATYTSGNFTYSYVVGSGVATLYRYSGSDTSVNIPSSFTIKVGTYSDGLDKFETFYVTAIDSGAFKNNKTITSVSWSSRLKKINGDWSPGGGGAFQGCTNLANIPSLSGITHIGLSAFEGCTSLTSVEVPSSVTYLGMSAFLGCTGLKAAVVNCSGIVPSGLFGGCMSLESLVLGDGITGIEGEFRGYVTYAPYPLSGCSNLKSISLGSGFTVIPGGFIAGLSLVERVSSSGIIKTIGDGAFYNCTNLTDFPNLSAVTNIGSSAFYGCSKIESVQFGANLKSIGERAFYNCTSASSFAFAGAPPSVGLSAFSNVKNGAVGTYVASHVAAWDAVIDSSGYWKGLKMKPSYPKPSASDGTVPGGIEVTWTDGGCEQYELFRGESENGQFDCIAVVTGNTYFDSSVEWGKPYWYYVNRVSGQKRVRLKAGSTTGLESNVDEGYMKSDSELPKIEDVDVGELWLSGEGPYYCFLTWNNFDKERYYVSSITFDLIRSDSGKRVWWFAPKVSLSDGDCLEVFDVSQNNSKLVPKGKHGQHKLKVTWEVTDKVTGKKVKDGIKRETFCDNVKVFFNKYGMDNSGVPNWLFYWPKDGAVSSREFGKGKGEKNDGLFRFDPSLPPTTRGRQTQTPGLKELSNISVPDGFPPVYQLKGECAHAYVLGVNGGSSSVTISSTTFPTYRGRPVGQSVVGVKKLAATIAHEKKHGEIADATYAGKYAKGWLFIGGVRGHNYLLQSSVALINRLVEAGYTSSHPTYGRYYDAIIKATDSGQFVTDFDGDGIADTDETGGLYGGWGFSNMNADTYNFAAYEESYATYGDNEVLARDAEKNGFLYMGKESEDWSCPGFQIKENWPREYQDKIDSIIGCTKSMWDQDNADWKKKLQARSRNHKEDWTAKISMLTKATHKRILLRSADTEDECEYVSTWHGTESSLCYITVSTGDVHVVSCIDAGVVRDGSGRGSSLGWSLVLTNATEEAMSVKLRCYLTDSETNALAWAATNVECAVGLTAVEMRFDAEDIFLWDTSRLMLYAATIESSVGDMGWMISEQAPCALTAAEYSAADIANDKGRIVPSSVAVIATSEGVMVTGEVVRVSGDTAQIYASLTETNGLAVTSAMIDAPGVGTNDFSIFFPGDELYRLAKPLPYVVDSLRLAENDVTVHEVYAVGTVNAEDARWFRSADLTIHALAGSGAWSEPQRGADGLCSQITYSFVVSNAEDTVKACHARATLLGTNEEHVCSLNLPVELSAGLNTVSMSFSSIDMKAHEYDGGVYRIGNVFVESDDGNEIEVLHTDGNSIAVARSELAGAPFMLKGAPQFCYREADGTNLASVVVKVDVARPDTITASVLLVDGEGKYVATARTSETVGEVGERTLILTFDPSEVKTSGHHGPYTISYLLLKSSIEGVEDVCIDDFVVRDVLYLEQVAAPVFSPVTKTVFFRREQTVSISCATPAAEIRYTLDGSEPTASSKLYDGSFVITNSVTVKAKAFVEGLSPSETAQAEYVRAAIVGDNLVQNTSPEAGVSQIVSVPVPGAYQVSFDYTQGGDVELRLSQDGTVRTLATVSAASGGTTNFLFDVSAAGNYELVVYDHSSGTSQPAEVSNLNISIPDTPENRRQLWIYETENTFGSTGEWITEHGFQNGKMPVDGTSTFKPYTQSDGRFVTIVSTVEFDSYCYGEDPDFDCKAAIICVAEDEALVFKVPTMENGVRVWKTVGAEGLAEPVLNTPYTVKFTLDGTNRTYSVAIIGEGNAEFTLTHGTTNEFVFAGQRDTAFGQVRFEGTGNVISLLGNYKNSDAEFMRGDVLQLVGGQSSQALTEGQAGWLNSMKCYDVVKAKVATMGLADFNNAYLLNLDISQSEFGLGMFKVTGIEVTEDEVRVSVTLNRAGAIQVSHGGTNRDAPINGLLKLYGGVTPDDRTLLNATVITDDSFSSGDTEVFTYPRSGPARFFCPAIVSP